MRFLKLILVVLFLMPGEGIAGQRLNSDPHNPSSHKNKRRDIVLPAEKGFRVLSAADYQRIFGGPPAWRREVAKIALKRAAAEKRNVVVRFRKSKHLESMAQLREMIDLRLGTNVEILTVLEPGMEQAHGLINLQTLKSLTPVNIDQWEIRDIMDRTQLFSAEARVRVYGEQGPNSRMVFLGDLVRVYSP